MYILTLILSMEMQSHWPPGDRFWSFLWPQVSLLSSGITFRAGQLKELYQHNWKTLYLHSVSYDKGKAMHTIMASCLLAVLWSNAILFFWIWKLWSLSCLVKVYEIMFADNYAQYNCTLLVRCNAIQIPFHTLLLFFCEMASPKVPEQRESQPISLPAVSFWNQESNSHAWSELPVDTI